MMAALTLKGIPEDVMDRLRELAEVERRSLNQQAILLLERAVAEQPASFGTAYRQFRERHGPSPLEEGDFHGLRSDDPEREVTL
ncbi:MAG: plasmid stability protein [Bacteroidetes bacterium]|nr:plasmid stability protein [Bacteroidota bacterium]